jgi:hypothetical protein
LEDKDTKNAAAIQRKIVMKGCNKQWVHAIRQIIMNLETIQAEVIDFKQDENIGFKPVEMKVPEIYENSVTKSEWI